MLFGKCPSFDCAEYYETCARAKTYEQHMSGKNYVLEHTKPLFIEKKILSLHHLYYGGPCMPKLSNKKS